jgi:hypothetical protein
MWHRMISSLRPTSSAAAVVDKQALAINRVGITPQQT